jgi:hypothetical protein
MASKIGIRHVLAMQPHTILWDSTVRGFNARKQFGIKPVLIQTTPRSHFRSSPLW